MKLMNGLIVKETHEFIIRRRKLDVNDFVLVNVALPDITDDMIDNAEVIDDMIIFKLPDIESVIKSALINSIKSSCGFDMVCDHIENVLYDISAIPNNKDGLKSVTIGATVGFKNVNGDDDNEYNSFNIVLDSQKEEELLLSAVLKVLDIENWKRENQICDCSKSFIIKKDMGIESVRSIIDELKDEELDGIVTVKIAASNKESLPEKIEEIKKIFDDAGIAVMKFLEE